MTAPSGEPNTGTGTGEPTTTTTTTAEPGTGELDLAAEVEKWKSLARKHEGQAKKAAAELAKLTQSRQTGSEGQSNSGDGDDSSAKLLAQIEQATQRFERAQASAFRSDVEHLAGRFGEDLGIEVDKLLLGSDEFTDALAEQLGIGDDDDPLDVDRSTGKFRNAVKAALTAAAEAHPRYKTKRFSGASGDGGPRGTSGPDQLTREDVRRLYKAGKHQEIDKARREGRLADLLSGNKR